MRRSGWMSMLTFVEFQDFRAQIEQGADEDDFYESCGECDGSGECECCGRDCLECDGSGEIDNSPTERDLHHMYFAAIVRATSELCASSSRHDFLDEVGAIIKTIGRPGSGKFYAHCQNGKRFYVETD